MSVQRWPYQPGDRVLVEAVVQATEYGRPFGEVTVRVAEATDPSGLLDGVDLKAPQVIVHPIRVDVPADFTAVEGFYEAQEATE